MFNNVINDNFGIKMANTFNKIKLILFDMINISSFNTFNCQNGKAKHEMVPPDYLLLFL